METKATSQVPKKNSTKWRILLRVIKYPSDIKGYNHKSINRIETLRSERRVEWSKRNQLIWINDILRYMPRGRKMERYILLLHPLPCQCTRLSQLPTHLFMPTVYRRRQFFNLKNHKNMGAALDPPQRTWSQDNNANSRICLGLWIEYRSSDDVSRHQHPFGVKRLKFFTTATVMSSQFWYFSWKTIYSD